MSYTRRIAMHNRLCAQLSRLSIKQQDRIAKSITQDNLFHFFYALQNPTVLYHVIKGNISIEWLLNCRSCEFTWNLSNPVVWQLIDSHRLPLAMAVKMRQEHRYALSSSGEKVGAILWFEYFLQTCIANKSVEVAQGRFLHGRFEFSADEIKKLLVLSHKKKGSYCYSIYKLPGYDNTYALLGDVYAYGRSQQCTRVIFQVHRDGNVKRNGWVSVYEKGDFLSRFKPRRCMAPRRMSLYQAVFQDMTLPEDIRNLLIRRQARNEEKQEAGVYADASPCYFFEPVKPDERHYTSEIELMPLLKK